MRLLAVFVLLIGALFVCSNPPQQLSIQAYGPGFDPGLSLLKEIRDEIRSLRADVRSQMPSGGPMTQSMDYQSVIQLRCAKCHESSVSEAEGGGFTLMENGKIVDLRTHDVKHIAKRTSNGTMPPGGGLSEGEKKALANIPVRRK